MKTSKWSIMSNTRVEDSPRQRALKEFDYFQAICEATHFPQMSTLKVLGAIDKDGQPQDPVYAFGKMLSKGSNLSKGRNHATYINKVGYYDIVRTMNDEQLQA